MARPIDLTGVPTGGFPVYPAGDYPAFIFEYKFGIVEGEGAKNPGADKIDVRYKLEDGGGSTWETITLVPNTFWKFKQLAVAGGIDPVELEGEVDPEYVMETIQGNPVILTLGIRPKTPKYAEKNSVTNVRNPSAVLAGAGAASGQGW